MAGKKDIVEQALKMIMGAADEAAPISRIGMNYKDVTKRVPELTEAAKRVQAGEIGQPEYSALVDRFKPVEPYASVPDPASVDDMVRALTANKRDKIGKLADYQEGHPVALRLDIPAYTGHGVWVPTIHDQKTFKSISHEPAAHITGAQFSMPENKALAVAAGGAKGPFATIDGSLLKTPPEAIHERAKSVLNDPDWVQVGMDPERHSYFYDRKTMQPVMSAEEVIQVGPLVLARKPVYGNAEDFKYSEGGSIREGYQTKGRVVGDVVEQALKLVAGAGEQAAPKLSQANLEDFIKTHFPDASPNYSASNTDKYGPSSSIYYYIPSENGNKTIRLSDHDLGAREGVDLRYGEDLDMAKYKILKNFGVLSDEDLLKMFPKQIENEKINQLNSWQQMFDEHVNWVNNTKKKSERQTLIDEYLKTHPKPTFNSGGSVREGYGPGGIIDDVVRLAGKVISGEGDDAAQAGIRAYHGSPHDFDKFDMSKIGTGEGAQAYGHGLYFADREGIAKSYRDTLSPKNYLLNAPESEIAQKYGQDVLDMFSSHGGDPNKIKDTVNRLSEQNKRDLYDLGVSDVSQVKPQNDWGIEANLVNRADRLNRLQSLLASQDVKINPGHMYEVNIAADPNTFLDWDKPLSEQPDIYEKLKSSGKLNVNEAVVAGTEKRLISLAGQLGINDLVPIRVQSGLRRGLSLSDALTEAKGATQNPEWSAQVDKLAEAILPTGVEMKGNLPQNWTGQSLVDSKVNGLTKRQVSEILSKEGIPGIKYLDAGSRGAGDGTRNYVVFDDKLISIIRKYGIAGASAMLGYNLMENLDANQARAATAADMDYQSQKQAKANGGPVREGYQTKGRVVGDVVEQALKLIAGTGPELTAGGIRAYHGSPHYVDRFDVSKIGTGEGNQAYGHGLYFAGKEDIAKSYRDKLSDTLYDVSGKRINASSLSTSGKPHEQAAINAFWRMKGDKQAAIDNLMEFYRAEKNPIDKRAADFLAKVDIQKVPGHMYEVEIAADPNRLIDWNDPLKEQPADVRSAIMPFAEERADRMNKARREMLDRGVDMMGRPFSPKRLETLQQTADPETFTGENIYRHIQAQLGAGNVNDKAAEASQFLTEKGLHGIQYLDASSRGAGVIEPTKNFVIPEDKRISIIRRYADGGEVDDDVNDALRIAKGGGGAFTKAVKALLGEAEGTGLSALTKPGSGYLSVEGKPSIVKIPGIGEVEAKPIPQIDAAAEEYMRKHGTSGSHRIESFPPLDEELATRIAEEYGSMKHAPKDPEVKRAFDALAQETLDQLEAAKKAGIDLTFIKGEDPYKASPSLGYADLSERGHMYVFPTEQGFGSDIAFDPVNNPMLKRIGKLGNIDDATVNDAFRIVHDLFGHHGPGNPFFRAPGEERAFKLHSRMYSPEALPAMASETRGQNSWLNYGPYGRYNRKADAQKTLYADQKTGLMPPWTYEKSRGGEVDDDVNDALRIAKDVGGGTPVMMEDAKGNKYDAQGNVIPQDNTVPNPQRVDMQSTYNALLSSTPPEKEQSNYEVWQSLRPEERADFSQKYPDYAAQMRQQDIAASEKQVRDMPEPYRSMTHPLQRFQTSKGTAKINAPLLGGTYEYSAPDVSDYVTGQTTNPSQEYVQAIYDNKTLPFYFTPAAPLAATADVAEGVINQDPLQAAMAALGYNSVSNLFGKGVSAAGRAIYDAVKSHPYITGGVLGAGSLGVGSDEAEAGPARWFSKAVEVARAIPMNKMTGEQALAMLRKGTSPEELRWMGAEDFLSGQKSVSKDDLVAFLEKNRVQPTEIVLGGGGKPGRREDVRPDADIVAKYRDEREKLQQEYNDIRARLKGETDFSKYEPLARAEGEKYRALNAITERMIDEQIARMGGLGLPVRYGPGSQYGEKYVTRGGKDYRETLVQLPQRDDYTQYIKKMRGEAYGKIYQSVIDDGGTERLAQSLARKTSHNMEPEEIANFLGKRDEFLKVFEEQKRRDFGYKSQHWEGYPNVLAHVRTQMLDVTPPAANRPYKAFNVDEAQSDWAKAGREKGFVTPEDRASFPGLVKQYDELNRQRRDVERIVASGDDADPQTSEAAARMADLNRQMMELSDKMTAIRSGGVPVAPYVTGTQGWTDLSIKKSIDQALDAGADYFTWTPGDVQAERYGLDKQISGLKYDPLTKVLDYLPKDYVDDDFDWLTFGSEIEPEKLEDYVGKEVAEKLLASPGDKSGVKSLSRLDLKVGGEGMRGYYDKVYLKRLQEVVKKATGEKPNIEVIEVQTANGPRKQLGIRLTDEMREKARFSDFNKGGRVTGGNTYDNDSSVAHALALTSEY